MMLILVTVCIAIADFAIKIGTFGADTLVMMAFTAVIGVGLTVYGGEIAGSISSGVKSIANFVNNMFDSLGYSDWGSIAVSVITGAITYYASKKAKSITDDNLYKAITQSFLAALIAIWSANLRKKHKSIAGGLGVAGIIVSLYTTISLGSALASYTGFSTAIGASLLFGVILTMIGWIFSIVSLVLVYSPV